MAYKRKRVVYEDVIVNPNDLVTIMEASRLTGLSKQGVASAIDRGVFTEIINDQMTYHGRRLILKSEIVLFLQKNN